jgi:hypothetical protein
MSLALILSPIDGHLDSVEKNPSFREFIQGLFDNRVTDAIMAAVRAGFPREITDFVDNHEVRKKLDRYYHDSNTKRLMELEARGEREGKYYVFWEDIDSSQVNRIDIDSKGIVDAYCTAMIIIGHNNPRFHTQHIQYVLGPSGTRYIPENFLKTDESKEKVREAEEQRVRPSDIY